MFSHEDELANVTESESNVTTSTEEQPPQAPPMESDNECAASTTSTAEQLAKSIKCEDCGKLFKNQTEVEYHATKSG